MAKKDMHTIIEHETLMVNEAISTNTTTDSLALETDHFMAQEFILTGNSITDGSYAITLIEGDTDTAGVIDTPTVVDAADVLVTVANQTLTVADDEKSVRIGYRGTKARVAVRVVSTAVTTGGTFNVIGINGKPNYARTDDDKA